MFSCGLLSLSSVILAVGHFVVVILLFLGTVFLTVYFISLLLVIFSHPGTKQAQSWLAPEMRHAQGVMAYADSVITLYKYA